jgi:biotin transport system substrate-specific component
MSTMNQAADAARVPVLADLLNSRSTAVTILKNVLLIAAGAGFVALMAQWTIARVPVPVTAQTFAVILVGASLGWKRGMAALGLYAILGFFLPIYALGGSGTIGEIGSVAGATGGYIVGFIFAAGAVGWLAERGQDRKVLTAFLSFVVGQLIIFAFGLAGLKLAAPELVEIGFLNSASWGTVIHEGFTIFIWVELVKVAIAALLLPSAWKILEWTRKDT